MRKAASIRQKLLDISKKENIAFQVIIIRYLHERLLYRLSRSEYCNNFYLKGGTLLYNIQNEVTRPTKDIDLLASQIEGSEHNLRDVFQGICKIKDNDGTFFKPESVQAEPIQENNRYKGIRIHVQGGFHSIHQRLKIDIGFGDKIIPKPQYTELPLLLQENTPVKLLTYTRESVIAEKLHAAMVLSYANSRMKDFYDMYFLLKEDNLDNSDLKTAIISTFSNRDTPFIKEHEFFTKKFHQDQLLNQRWERFLNRQNIEAPGFKEIIIFIQKSIKNLLEI